MKTESRDECVINLEDRRQGAAGATLSPRSINLKQCGKKAATGKMDAKIRSEPLFYAEMVFSGDPRPPRSKPNERLEASSRLSRHGNAAHVASRFRVGHLCPAVLFQTKCARQRLLDRGVFCILPVFASRSMLRPHLCSELSLIINDIGPRRSCIRTALECPCRPGIRSGSVTLGAHRHGQNPLLR